MTNKEIYRKTLGFSIRRLFFDLLTLILFAGCCIGGFLIADKMTEKGLIGLLIGLVVGIVVAIILSRFVSYSLKAGQIAMMTRGITEDKLPDNVYREGKKAVKERFATVAAFFAITSAVKAIFSELGRGITKLGNAVGGDTGSSIGSAGSAGIQTMVNYLCDCCLGWVFFRKQQGAVKAACEGAVLFFKHGKTFFKNMGRIFGMGLVSLLLIGGAFSAGFYALFQQFPAAFTNLAAEISEAAVRLEREIPAILTNPATLIIVCAVIAGIVVWSVLHSVFVKPLVLTGVLRNYLESGIKDIPTEASFDEVASKSRKFSKLQAKLEQ